jgi:hypothetical protein
MNLEKRINIKLCVQIGKSASETVSLLTLTYCEYDMNKSNAFEYQRQFREGREDVKDDSRNEQPKTQRTGANVDRVGTLVHSDRRLCFICKC